MSVVSTTCYELLGVPVHSTRADAAQAWRARRIALTTAPAGRTSDEIEALCARLDEAFEIVADPERARHYRAYLAQGRPHRGPLRPEELLHPVVAEWSALSTDTPVAPSPLPARGRPADDPDAAQPAEAPPWLGAAGRKPTLEEAIEAALGDGQELPEEDTIHTLDDWGVAADPERHRTVMAGPAIAAPRPPPPPRRSPITTGRSRAVAMPRPKTTPGTRARKPWDPDDR